MCAGYMYALLCRASAGQLRCCERPECVDVPRPVAILVKSCNSIRVDKRVPEGPLAHAGNGAAHYSRGSMLFNDRFCDREFSKSSGKHGNMLPNPAAPHSPHVLSAAFFSLSAIRAGSFFVVLNRPRPSSPPVVTCRARTALASACTLCTAKVALQNFASAVPGGGTPSTCTPRALQNRGARAARRHTTRRPTTGTLHHSSP